MTRKDYIAIAAILKRAHETHTDHAPILQIESDLIDLFINDNPRFDTQRFKTAASVE